jgi:3-oxoacyl-[acyl-carrier protein] reductase
VAYNTVKAALSGYVRSLGRELAKIGVVVTGILPGAFYAPSNSWRRLEESKPDVVESFIKNNLPRGIISEAEELIPLLLLLAGDNSSMLSGSCVPIDGGEGRSRIP